MNHLPRLRGIAAALFAAAVLVLPGAATAVNSYNGNDYSVDFNRGHQIKTCDKESDSRQVHADVRFRDGTSKGVVARDADGSNGRCATSGYDARVVRTHRTCEEIRFAPDSCGSWKGTGY